jgi:hypothetical protein
LVKHTRLLLSLLTSDLVRLLTKETDRGLGEYPETPLPQSHIRPSKAWASQTG